MIEILITMGITLILARAAIPVYGNLQASAQVNEGTAQIVQTMRTAWERSFAGLNNSPHGVYFEINSNSNDRYILYQGVSYVSRNATYDRVVTLDEALSLSTDFSDNEVNFSKGFGVPDVTGTISLTHSVKGERVISVNSMGVTEEQ